MRYQTFIFDLDGTLCPLGKAIAGETVWRLQALEQSGGRIVLCSGKPTYYLCGMARQMGLSNPILIGENGAVLQYGVALPPTRYCRYPCSIQAMEQLRQLRRCLEEAFGDEIWYQPNEVALTPFPSCEAGLDAIQSVLDAHPEFLTELQVYRQVDCFDILPEGIHKGNGVALLAKQLGLSPAQMISFGDGENDIPMFALTGCSVAIGSRVAYPTDYTFPDIGTALGWVYSQLDLE